MSKRKNQKKTIEKSLSDLEKLVAELENGELELDQVPKNTTRNRDEDKNSYGR